MDITCKICNKKYSSKNSLYNHIRIYHSTKCSPNVSSCGPNVANAENIISDLSKVNNLYKCKFCNKTYKNRHSKYRHQLKCSNNMSVIDKKIEEKVEEKLKLLQSNTKLITNTNSHNNNKINNGIINHITINKVGDEKYLNLSDENIKLIFSKEIESVFTFVELLNFNKELPENHNHCVTNLEGSYVNVFNSDTKTVQVDQKKYFFDTLLCKSIDRMEILFNLNKKQFNDSKQEEIKNSIDTLKRLQDSYYNKKLFSDLIDKLTLIAYNNKNLVIDTWTDKPKKPYNFREDLENTTHEEFLEERKKRLGEDYVNKRLEINKSDSSDEDIMFSNRKTKNKLPNIICSSDESD